MRLAFRELRHGGRFAILFVFSLALGFCGFLTLQSLKASISKQLESQAEALLGGDIGISTQQPLQSAEWERLRSALGPVRGESIAVEFPSMAASRSQARLVQVKAVDASFPLRGELKLQRRGMVTPSLMHRFNTRMWAWVEPELLVQLKLSIGDTVRVGNYAFEIDDVLAEAAPNSWRSMSVVPRLYLGFQQVEALGMLPPQGSLAFYEYLFLLPEHADASAVASRIRSARTQAGITVHTAESASYQSAEVLSLLTDFLGLASLVSLFLAAIGAAYLLHSFVIARYREIAILMCLGLTPRRARLLYLFQAVVLGAISIVPAAILAWLFLIPLSRAVTAFTPFAGSLALSLPALATTFFLAIVGSCTIAFPAVASIRHCQPATLLHETTRRELNPSWLAWWTLLPFICFLWLLASVEAHSLYLGTVFVAAVLASTLFLGLASMAVIRLFSHLASHCSLAPRLALRGLVRNRFSSFSCFLGISSGCLLINLVAQTQLSLDQYIGLSKRQELPSLFLFDIQEGDVDGMQALLSSLGLSLDNLSPIISAELVRHNGEPFDFALPTKLFSTREHEREAFFRNRSLNLTYRPYLSSAESIVSGRPYRTQPVTNSSPAEVSIEENFAKRLGWKLGDSLEFDVQGVPIRAEIVNLRRVQWSSFRPNFFIQFQSHVLEEAPKTFLATIRVPPNLARTELQNQIITTYPDIVIVDIAYTLQRIHTMLEQMLWAMRLMAWISLATGLFVVYAIARYQVSSRLWEVSLMKILGASWKVLFAAIAIEFGTIAAVSTAFGAIASYFVGSLFAHLFFNSIWLFSWPSAILVGIITTLLCLLTGLLATRHTLVRSAQGQMQALWQH